MSSADGAVDLIDFIVKAIVDEPEAVRVTAKDGGRLIELETSYDPRGRGIRRQGRVAPAMRAVLGASRSGADCRLDIVD